MTRFVQSCTLLFALLCAADTLNAEPLTKISLSKGYNLAEGKNIYSRTCASCHDSGIMNAPMIGDAKAWAPRVAKGIDLLVKHTNEGYLAMPPKGGLKTLSATDGSNATAYLIEKALP